MTTDELRTKHEASKQQAGSITLSFGFRPALVIRHSRFVISMICPPVMMPELNATFGKTPELPHFWRENKALPA